MWHVNVLLCISDSGSTHQRERERVQHLTRLAAAGGNPVYLSDGVDLALAAFNFRYRRLALHPTLGHLNLRQSRVFARCNPSSA